VLLDRLVPGLGVQTVAVTGAVFGAILALSGVVITQGVNVYTARSNKQDEALQKYLDDEKTSQMLSERQASENRLSDVDRAAAMAKTRSLLLRSDQNSTRVLLQLFHEAHLLEKDKDHVDAQPVIKLSEMNLSGANLQAIDLAGDSLRGVNLRGADMRDSNLKGADMRGVDLGEIGLRDVSILASIRVYMRDLFFSGNPMPGYADLRGVELSSADLSGAKGLDRTQIEKALGDGNTKLPEGMDPIPAWKQSMSAQPNGDTNKVDTEDSNIDPQHGEAQPREVPENPQSRSAILRPRELADPMLPKLVGRQDDATKREDTGEQREE
jgi:uncharacterized protein YjbI with pentapeptide repeats